MKPKIITGEETVGYYWSSGKILSKTYNQLAEDEQQDYLTEDDDRKYIFIDSHDGSFDSIIEMYYTKEFLIETEIEEIEVSIIHEEKLLRIAQNNIVKLKTNLEKYIEMKSQIKEV
jgi:hypothetical protein